MALSEFQLIQRFFADSSVRRADVALGVGDDCAVLRPPAGKELVVSMDTLVEGVHFIAGVEPESLGHKALAVNLSDLAAMGAEPAWVTLALTLPAVDEAWLAAFCRGFSVLAGQYGVQLIGGDTTRGPLSITVQAHGFVDPDAALRRDGARPGDLICVTGLLGDAGLALHMAGAETIPPSVQRRLDRPAPRLAEGRALVGLASAAIDLSDGLLADLGHLCEASGVGATLQAGDLPCSRAVRDYVRASGDWALPFSAGDDYELCFTVPPGRQAAMVRRMAGFACGVTCIGRIEAAPGIRCLGADGDALQPGSAGYEHFSASH